MRRWSAAVMVTALASALALASPAAATTSSQPWPSAHGGATRTGYVPNESTISSATVPSFGRVWSTPIGSSAAHPAVADARVVVGARDGTVRAFDENTGAPQWVFDGHGSISTTPAIADGAVFASVSAPIGQTPTATVYAVNEASGALLWSHPIGNPTADPAEADGTVYVPTQSAVDAYDAATGAQLWEASVASWQTVTG